MSILITGIDMPTKGNPITVSIYPDGTAEWEAQNKKGTAVPVPPHGDLIDRDAYQYSGDLMDEPVIIPAEEVEK